ncbi:MAG: hypothetical protein ACKVS5_14515 [Parvularculaceae bacterium]
MRISRTSKLMLLAGSAIALVTACSDADVASPGNGTPIIINPIPPGTGTGSGFATRSTAPITASNCPAGTTFVTGVQVLATGNQTNFCSLTPLGGGTITGTRNIPLTADPILISGTVFLGDAAGTAANVTFAAGQRFVTHSVSGIVDLLVVARGSLLNAAGTAASPIVFTSMQDFNDDGMPNGSTGTGEWGGIAINGRAPLNECTVNPAALAGTDACRQNGEGGSGVFGGADANDSSGVFRYVRVQHAGFPFTPTNELNSVALQGVGRGTTFEFVQVHRGADDGFEWFGGTVNANHLVVTGANDDSLDWTDGWSGAVQFAVVVQQTGDDNGIEGDNNGDTSPDAAPRSSPRLSNLTLIGDGVSGEGIQVRAGTAGALANVTVANFAEGLEFNPAGTGPNPTVRSTVLGGNVVNFSGSGATLFSAGTNNITSVASTLNGVFPGANETNTPAVNPTTIDPTFVAGSYVGAFGGTDTPALNWTTGWTVANSIPGVPAAACPTGTTASSQTPAAAGFAGRTESLICIVTNPVVGNVRLTSGNLYRLDGSVFVGADRGGDPAVPTPGTIQSVLTIDPGVTMFGNQQTGIVDLLVVSRGNQIFANGSAVAPVVLTSRSDLANGGVIRPTATGEIGGIAINGRAPLNECTINPAATPATAACAQNGEGGSGAFGGGTPTDNSGRITYMQVRYAGFPFTPTNELNSIALQGVGNATLVDFIQVINGADDGVEWFGGNVNVSHVVVLGANDDSIDWTDGWAGTVQYVIARQNAGDDNGVEGDNNGDTSPDAAPRSRAAVANMTLIGDGASGEGIQLRAGTQAAVSNSIVTNFAEALEYNLAGTGGDPTLNSTAFSGIQTPPTLGVLTGATSLTLFSASGNNTNTAANTLTAPAGFVTRILPGANESAPAIVASNPVTLCNTLFTGVVNPPTPNPCSSLEATTYVGAVQNASDTWYAGWTLGL